MRKAISGVCNALGSVILVVIILAAGAILALQLLGNAPMAILSGSMEPQYPVGGLVFINTKVTPEEIAPGDVISFYLNEETVVTHRVVSVDAPTQTFETKGDNNNSGDLAPVPWQNLIGRALFHVPLLGYALMNLKTAKGIGAGIIVIALLIVLFVVPVLLAPSKVKPETELPEKGENGNE